MRIFLTICLLLVSIPLLATPSALTWIPNTDTVPTRVWHLDSDVYIFSHGLNGATANAPYVDEGLVYGITSRVEAGVDYGAGYANAFGDRVSPIFFNAKYQFITPSAKTPVAAAVGLYNLSPQNAANAALFYAVGAYTFKGGTRLTAGGYTGNSAVIGDDDAGFLIGVDRTLGNWWVTADYQSGQNLYGAWNAGVGYNITPKLLVFAGYDQYNSPSSVGAHSSVNIQIDINL